MTRTFIGLFLLLGIVEPALALRCGHKLVSEGDYIEEVRVRCGDPVAIDTYTILRERRILYPGHYSLTKLNYPHFDNRANYAAINRSIQVEIIVEEWVYNFGPHRLMRRLHFENGILREIVELGHGYIQKRQ